MNTPAHLIFAAAAFGGRTDKRVLGAAVLGGFLPDLSLYAMAGVSLFGLGISPQRVFGELYYSDAWQQVFAIDNSFILWGIALAVAYWKSSPVFMALTAGALLHLFLDFPLHGHDARMHFWPLTEWKFYSPLSYWDTGAGAHWVGLVEVTLSAIGFGILWTRWRTWGWRLFFGILLLMQFGVSGIWSFVFQG